MNLDFFGVFDYKTGDGSTYQYTATEFSEILRALSSNGIVKGYQSELKPTISGLKVTVGKGSCFIYGHYGKISTSKVITLDAATTARKDRIVVRCDIPNRTMSLEVIKGTSDTAPAITDDDIPIATVSIPANSTATTIVDERAYYYPPTVAQQSMEKVLNGTTPVYACYA